MVEEIKMVVVVRKDLDLGKGKMAAQAAHAAVTSAMYAMKHEKKMFHKWISEGQKKVVLRAENLKVLYSYRENLESAGIKTFLITDAGLTQIPPGTVTCFGTVPVESSVVDEITGDMPLF